MSHHTEWSQSKGTPPRSPYLLIPSQAMARTVKVAVIGSGLAGLTAAYLLARASATESEVEFEVHVFEKVSPLTNRPRRSSLTHASSRRL